MRAAVAYHIGARYGPFGHTQPASFFGKFQHAEWLARLREEVSRSKETFLVHFREKYREFPDVPVWIATEVMSLGSLSTMLNGMLKTDQRAIAGRYHLQARVLSKAMHHFTYIRNLCAHHSRIWDRVWAIKPELPAGSAWQPPHLPGNSRLFASLVLLRQILARIPAVEPFSIEWRNRVAARLASPPPAVQALAKMGLTDSWSQHPIWIE